MSLREAVETNHRAAEQTALARAMIDGTMGEELYHQFLFNMREVYAAIERKITFLPADVQRVQRYTEDLDALGRGAGTPLQSTQDYVRYINGLDVPATWAHVYVHYLGNMYGGQMLRKKLSWKSSHLDFNDVKACIGYVRTNIEGVDPAEANRAFERTIAIYDELHRHFGRNGAAA